MKIYLNEQPLKMDDGTTLLQLRDQQKPDADVIVYNGAIVDGDCTLVDDDRITLIKRGDIPQADELEALMVARHTPGVHEKIKQASVGIAGLGGLGSAIAVALARIGIGKLILADFDVVEPSNLNRQQYFIDQLGLPKAEALCENLRRINPYVDVEAHNLKLTSANIPGLFADADVMVEAFDRADQKAMLLQTWTSTTDKPIVAASGLAGHGPSETIGVRKMGERVFIVGDLETAAAPGCGLMAPRVGIAAHIQANLVLRILLGEE